MDTHASRESYGRSEITWRSIAWAYNFLVFALLTDIIFRSLILQEAAWDLFALLFVSGAIARMYTARNSALMLSRKHSIFMALGIIVAAVVAFFLGLSSAR